MRVRGTIEGLAEHKKVAQAHFKCNNRVESIHSHTFRPNGRRKQVRIDKVILVSFLIFSSPKKSVPNGPTIGNFARILGFTFKHDFVSRLIYLGFL